MLEILISIGLILVGLLGVAALLPVARYDMVTSLRADRGAACARAAMRDLVVRKMLDSTLRIYGTTPNLTGEIVIDPIAFEAGSYYFPANSTLNPMYQIDRVTIRSAPNWGAMSAAVARRVFTSGDDLQFELPGERTERPRQQFIGSDGNVWTSALPADLQTYQTADPEGAYSWIATVSPGPDAKQSTVSVVVFYNRDPAPDRELSCGVTPSVAGGVQLGGGDFTLFVPTAGVPATYDAAAVREKLMALKPGDWILLRGVRPMASGGTQYEFKWYRVAALGDFDPANSSRMVTLAGPDWDTSFATEAGLFERIVGVYTQTVELDR
jgi:hypothetical protein